MMVSQCPNRLPDTMQCSEFDAINVERTFANSANQSRITVDSLVKNGNREKELTIADSAQPNSRNRISIKTLRSKLFAIVMNAKVSFDNAVLKNFHALIFAWAMLKINAFRV